MTARVGDTKELLAYRIVAVDNVRHRHVVTGSKPTIGIAVEQHPTGLDPVVRAPGMPDAPVEYNRGPFRSENGHGAVGCYLAIGARKLVSVLAAAGWDPVM